MIATPLGCINQSSQSAQKDLHKSMRKEKNAAGSSIARHLILNPHHSPEAGGALLPGDWLCGTAVQLQQVNWLLGCLTHP